MTEALHAGVQYSGISGQNKQYMMGIIILIVFNVTKTIFLIYSDGLAFIYAYKHLIYTVYMLW